MAQENAVLIVAESADGSLAGISAELAASGRRIADALGGSLVALITGSDASALAPKLGELGVDRVLTVAHDRLNGYESDAYRATAEAAVRAADPAVVLIGQTPNGRDLAPRLAFRLGTGLVTDCTDLQVDADGSTVIMTKPVYGGSALAEMTVNARPQIATVRPRVFPPAEPADGQTAEVEPLAVDLDSVPVRVQAGETVKAAAAEGPRLKDAKVVISGGRGIGGPENWHVIDDLAEILGAAVGASRAVTDAGWVAPTLQVGLTGATIAPDLYITVGISGAVQHIAGCSGARNIVAINKDPDANIFKQARYGIVADYKQVMPAFIERVKQLRQG